MVGTSGKIQFTVQYDDMSYMGLWCHACLEAGLSGDANLLGNVVGNTWDGQWALEELNKIAEVHVKDKHGD